MIINLDNETMKKYFHINIILSAYTLEKRYAQIKYNEILQSPFQFKKQ